MGKVTVIVRNVLKILYSSKILALESGTVTAVRIKYEIPNENCRSRIKLIASGRL